MQTPIRTRFLTIVALAVACTLAGAAGADAQLERVVDPDWTLPRTADGQPDLQGLWGNKTLTPMERPDDVDGRAFLTDEEIARVNQQRVIDEQARDEAPAQRYESGGNVGGYGSYWLDSGDTVLSTGQTSLIVDPPTGRAPVRAWALEAKAYNLAHNGDHYRNMSVWDRLPVARGARLDAAGRLQQRLSHRADAGPRRHPARDDPRRPDHPAHGSTVRR